MQDHWKQHSFSAGALTPSWAALTMNTAVDFHFILALSSPFSFKAPLLCCRYQVSRCGGRAGCWRPAGIFYVLGGILVVPKQQVLAEMLQTTWLFCETRSQEPPEQEQGLCLDQSLASLGPRGCRLSWGDVSSTMPGNCSQKVLALRASILSMCREKRSFYIFNAFVIIYCDHFFMTSNIHMKSTGNNRNAK